MIGQEALKTIAQNNMGRFEYGIKLNLILSIRNLWHSPEYRFSRSLILNLYCAYSELSVSNSIRC